MEEKTLFKLTRAITDTGTDNVSSKGGTITYRITSLKRKPVNVMENKVLKLGREITTLDLEFEGTGERTTVMVESLIYKYINGNLAQEYATSWKVESQNLPLGSTLETSEIPSQLTITVPANDTSSTRSGKIVLLQPASGKRITINYSQPTSIQNNGIIIYVYLDPSTQGKGIIQVVADHPAASNISIVMYIKYGTSEGRNQHNLILAKGQYLSKQTFDIPIGDNFQVLSYDYSPKEDSSYRYSVQIDAQFE